MMNEEPASYSQLLTPEEELAHAKQLLSLPGTVVICGSTRFMTEMTEADLRETKAGRIAPLPAGGAPGPAECANSPPSPSRVNSEEVSADLVRRVHLAARTRERGSPEAHQLVGGSFWAMPRWRQEPLFIAERDMSRVTVPDVEPIDPDFTAYVSARAEPRAEAQGWSPALRERVLRSLHLLTAVHGPHERIKASTVATLPRQRATRASTRVTEVLAHLDLLDDDRIDPLDAWIHRRLSDVHPEIRAEALVWIRIVRYGGPRRRPRSTATVRNQVDASAPFLLDCSKRYRTLRQVTRADLTEWLAHCASPHNDAVALRNMFKTLKSQRLLFVNPARGLRLGPKPTSVPTPLSAEAIQTLAAAAATDPALKPLIALIGIHALYPHQARALPLAAIDFTGGRLSFGDIDHPLDAITRQAAADCIHLRNARWPPTRNPHLFISSQTAHSRTPVTIGWMQPLLKDLPVTARRLREDRILEEAAVTGADPQHLCAVFNITPDTGLRYTRPFHL